MGIVEYGPYVASDDIVVVFSLRNLNVAVIDSLEELMIVGKERSEEDCRIIARTSYRTEYNISFRSVTSGQALRSVHT